MYGGKGERRERATSFMRDGVFPQNTGTVPGSRSTRERDPGIWENADFAAAGAAHRERVTFGVCAHDELLGQDDRRWIAGRGAGRGARGEEGHT